jgi:hypothetical protein
MIHDSGHTKHGKRGRHKRATSRETQRWNADYLIPERPQWMSAETYSQLAAMRKTA